MAAKPAPRELLGTGAVYLGGLNYFFPVHERVPVVSAVGTTVGELAVHITPHIEASVRRQPARGSSAPVFEPYVVVNSDLEEQQVYEFMDRPVMYRVELRHLSGVQTRRHSHVVARYSFFREAPTQTLVVPIGDAGSVEASLLDQSVGAPLGKSAALAAEFQHVVDVSDAFAKYIASASLTVEVFGLKP